MNIFPILFLTLDRFSSKPFKILGSKVNLLIDSTKKLTICLSNETYLLNLIVNLMSGSRWLKKIGIDWLLVMPIFKYRHNKWMSYIKK